MTLERLTEEHMKCQKLEQMLQIKEKQIVSVLEIAVQMTEQMSKI